MRTFVNAGIDAQIEICNPGVAASRDQHRILVYPIRGIHGNSEYRVGRVHSAARNDHCSWIFCAELLCEQLVPRDVIRALYDALRHR